MSERTPTHDRRTFLIGAAAFVAAACSDETESDPVALAEDSPANSAADSPVDSGSDGNAENGEAQAEVADGDTDEVTDEIESLTPAMFEALAICALAPSSSSGPFPTIDRMDRREIHEGIDGQPLRLGIRVGDDGCDPIPGAVVDVWHCDATGDYSEYTDDGSGKDEAEGSTFCRGFQRADDDGIVEFLTVYPGWYEGRAVHVHVSVTVDGENRLTAQLYFDEAATAAVHETGVYAEFGQPDTGWDDDGLIGDPATDGTGVVLTSAATSLGSGSLGLVNLGVS